jgi:DNA-binding Lrp family transcriptional regulator
MSRVKAYILIVTDPVRTKDVYAQLQAIREIVEVHEVMGPYDIVCEIQVNDITDIPPILGERVRRIPGIESTTSLVVFPERTEESRG